MSHGHHQLDMALLNYRMHAPAPRALRQGGFIQWDECPVSHLDLMTVDASQPLTTLPSPDLFSSWTPLNPSSCTTSLHPRPEVLPSGALTTAMFNMDQAILAGVRVRGATVRWDVDEGKMRTFGTSKPVGSEVIALDTMLDQVEPDMGAKTRRLYHSIFQQKSLSMSVHLEGYIKALTTNNFHFGVSTAHTLVLFYLPWYVVQSCQ
jgi:hypothetical protein